jgi:dihydroorotate dehydrogenase (fumarate)
VQHAGSRCVLPLSSNRLASSSPSITLTRFPRFSLAGLVFGEQIVEVSSSSVAQKAKSDLFALPGGWGGLAGAALHQTSLGCLLLFSLFPLPEKSLTENRSSSNIYRLSGLLKSSIDKRLSRITLIGVGGAHDAASVERFRQAGADAVVRSLLPRSYNSSDHFPVQACATALGRDGLVVFQKMRAPLLKL